jgi:GT2 family glycosyltransferase
MKVDIILCTKDRPTAITALLNNIGKIDDLHLATITVVDASQSLEATRYEAFSELFDIQVIRSSPGLPSQRNLGLRGTSNPVVSFLDDDVVLAKNFISATLNEFSKDQEIVGLGYLLKGVSFSPKRILGGLTLNYDERHFGQVSTSGLNHWYPEIGNKKVFRPPMWIPGCAMSFRRSGIEGMLFNPVLEKGILGGYALGEDVDFTLRLFAEGKKLDLTFETIVDHYEAPGERDNSAQLAHAQGDWLQYLANAHSNNVYASRIFLRLLIEFLYLHVTRIIGRGNASARICSRNRLLRFLRKGPYLN